MFVEEGNFCKDNSLFLKTLNKKAFKDEYDWITTDEKTHSPITYPVAVLKNSQKQEKAKAFEDFLLSEDGQSILEKYGFKKAN